MKKKLMATMLVLAMAVTSVAGCGNKNATVTTDDGKEVVTLNLSVPDPDSSYIYAAAQEFAKRAKEYSAGTLDITISANGSLYGGDASAGIKQLSAGGLDIVILSTSLYASFNPEFNVISVPFMFDDQAQLTEYLNSEPGSQLLNSMESSKIKTVGKWTRSFRKITNSKLPITQPGDLAGIKLRVPNNTLYVEYFTAAGATTTPMSFSEVYNALQLKTLDGQENPIDVPYSNKFNEVQKYISATDHMADAWLVGINADKFVSLSQEQQDAITKAGEEVQQWNVDYMAAEDEKALQFLLDNGMEYNELSDENKNKFVEISKGLYPTFKQLVANDELFDATTSFCNK
ncbi:DctP family TRAP transporter solute-binding subunit [Anaerotignum sp.]|uniref:DctP family TRAP transporter solute-binding subunit n=1 Tax=Anaerotignum sp. TaxID=2039241 RepID=UPI0028A96E11|nr:DctP family TRAP transporter solute-binding subunit [Anaerotignum sp.]